MRYTLQQGKLMFIHTIWATIALVKKLVYALYGQTEAEIAVVEGR